MIQTTLKVMNRLGLHARPAAQFVQTAAKFSSKVTIAAKGKTGNAKSLLTLMGMGVTGGTEITLHVDGEDEAACLDALTNLIETGFGEE